MPCLSDCRIIISLEKRTELELYEEIFQKAPSSYPFILDTKKDQYTSDDWSFMGSNPLVTVFDRPGESALDKISATVPMGGGAFEQGQNPKSSSKNAETTEAQLKPSHLICQNLTPPQQALAKKIPFLGGWLVGMTYEWMCREGLNAKQKQAEFLGESSGDESVDDESVDDERSGDESFDDESSAGDGSSYDESLSRDCDSTNRSARNRSAIQSFFSFYTNIYAIHHATGTIFSIAMDEANATECLKKLQPRQTEMLSVNASPGTTKKFSLCQLPDGKRTVFSNFSQKDYIKAIEKTKHHIFEGDIYQANVTQRFSVQSKRGVADIFSSVRSTANMPYGAFINFPFLSLISSSPEQLIKVKGRKIETRPIKGTIKSSPDTLKNSEQKQALLHSAKNNAELVMITDLERNDLGKICEPGTVNVKELVELKSFGYLHHLMSTIEGRLKTDINLASIVRAMVPGGSITGAPKQRAVEILSGIETVPRRWYTGAIGYVSINGNVELNVGIRTLYKDKSSAPIEAPTRKVKSADNKGTEWHFHGGGGIVADSNPKDEWEESVLKASNFFDHL